MRASILAAAWALFMVTAAFGIPTMQAEDVPKTYHTQPFASEGKIGCTGFSVNEQARLWATALHCIEDAETGTAFEKLTLGGEPFLVLRKSKEHDLALVLSTLSAPSLRLAPRAPRIGDATRTGGFAMRTAQITTLFGRISSPSFVLPDETFPVMTFDQEALPGMSGSPVFDERGRVVSVCQGVYKAPVGRVMWGARYEDLSEFIGKDWR